MNLNSKEAQSGLSEGIEPKEGSGWHTDFILLTSEWKKNFRDA